MDNPEVERIQVNIKGVRKKSWEIAARLASQHNESYGNVISRALDHLGSIDGGPLVIPPGNLAREPGNPSVTLSSEPIDRIALLNAVTAHSQVTGKRIPGATTFAAEMIREARGLAPLPKRLAGPGRARPAAVGHENGEARE